MGVVDLNLSEYGMCEEDASSSFAHKPVACKNVYWGAIQRVWMDRRGKDRETREDDKTSSERTTFE